MLDRDVKIGMRVRLTDCTEIGNGRLGKVVGVVGGGPNPLWDLELDPKGTACKKACIFSRRFEPVPEPKPTGRTCIEYKFSLRDLWVGCQWDDCPSGRHWFVCPFPGLVIHIYPEIK
jgi:hypothetical protein